MAYKAPRTAEGAWAFAHTHLVRGGAIDAVAYRRVGQRKTLGVCSYPPRERWVDDAVAYNQQRLAQRIEPSEALVARTKAITSVTHLSRGGYEQTPSVFRCPTRL